MKLRLGVILWAACSSLVTQAWAASESPTAAGDSIELPPLLPLDSFLTALQFDAPQISPDGKQILALASLDGVQNLVVAPIDKPTERRPLTHDTGRGFQAWTIDEERAFRWAANNTHVLYLRDERGDENWVLYSLDVASGKVIRLSPLEHTKARSIHLSWRFPDEVLFATNERTPARYDYFRANVVTGEVRPVLQADEEHIVYLFDHEFRPRIGVKLEPDLSLRLDVPKDDKWVTVRRIPTGDVQSLQSNHLNDLGGSVFSADNRSLIGFSSENRDTIALTRWDLESGRVETIRGLDNVDIKKGLVNPETYAPQAVVEYFTLARWIPIDPALDADFKRLAAFQPGEIDIQSRSRDDKTWIVSYALAYKPTQYFAYDRGAQKLTFIASASPQLESLKLSEMYAVVTKSSDGFPLVSYISYPPWVKVDANGKPAQLVPTLTLIHGGPSDERAQYGFFPLMHWINNRGYALFLVNFRGSPGFGKAFMNAQRHQWGGNMHRDVVEQAQYLVANGMAPRDKLGVWGGSYGGYATLIAMTKTPDLFACGNAVVGPSNLETFIAARPPEWSLASLVDRLGDPSTDEGRKLLRDSSPLFFASQTKGRMLIQQGANDVRVPQAESEQIVKTLVEHKVPVTYLVYPDEGHGFIRRENRMSSDAISEVFFGKCLGGRYRPITTEIEGSSVRVPVGAELIDGLPEALAQRKSDGMPVQAAAVTLPPETLNRYAGAYDLSGVRLTVGLKDDRLYVVIPGQGTFELLAQTETEFSVREAPTRFRFTAEGTAPASAITIVTETGNFEAPRTK